VHRSGKKIFTFFSLYYFLFTQYLYVDQTNCHASMTQQQQHAMTDIDSAVPLPTTSFHNQVALIVPLPA
jgi:hypothetical protein